MDRSEVVDLINIVREKDDLGIFTPKETKQRVFCSVESIGSTEFFNAGQNGLKPSLKFTLNRYEYNEQEVLEFNGVRYSIYRTYVKKGELIELYCERDIGTCPTL